VKFTDISGKKNVCRSVVFLMCVLLLHKFVDIVVLVKGDGTTVYNVYLYNSVIFARSRQKHRSVFHSQIIFQVSLD